jgi:predicted porin
LEPARSRRRPPFPGTINTQASETRLGWTTGVSAEYAFRTWLSAFVEYDCDGFCTRTVTFNTRGGTALHYTITESKNVVKAGLNLRWSPGAKF